MNILITGASGLIGRALITQLLAQEPRTNIFALTRNINAAKKCLPAGILLINKLTDVDFNQLDVVINLAGEAIADKRWSDKQKQRISDSRWQLTETLSQLINNAKTPPHTFISGSAVGFYGRQKATAINEQFSEIHDEFSHQLCQHWEDLALNASTEQTRVCVIRTGIVLANNGGALKKMLPAFKLGLGGVIGNGQQMMSWIHINDMVNILLMAIVNKNLSGPINATAPNPVSNQMFSRTLSKVLKRPCFCTVPAFLLKIMLGELAEIVLYGQAAVPAKLQQVGFTFEFSTLEPALVDLLAN